jgi:hypothetical protein
MNNKLSALLATAVVTGLMASQVVRAEDAPAKSGDQATAEKNSCKGAKHDKNGCKGAKAKDKKHDKNSCKNGCGEAKKTTEEGK